MRGAKLSVLVTNYYSRKCDHTIKKKTRGEKNCVQEEKESKIAELIT